MVIGGEGYSRYNIGIDRSRRGLELLIFGQSGSADSGRGLELLILG